MVTITLTYTGYMVLLRLSRPYNAYRIVLVVVTLACCLLGTFVLHWLFGVVYRDQSGELIMSLQDGLYMSTVVLTAYGVVTVLSSVISKINISAQPVEVAAAREEAERAEEERVLAEYREKKANASEIVEAEPAAEAGQAAKRRLVRRAAPADKNKTPDKDK